MKTGFLTIVLLALAACGGDPARTEIPSNDGDTSISDVQGDGDISPFDGRSVTVTGIVTGDFQDNDGEARNNLGGFYLQQEVPDASPATSDGIFVYDGGNPGIDIAVGDRVEVTGTVKEHFGETQIDATTVRVTGSGTISPTDIMLPTPAVVPNSDGDDVADLERYEGMLVRFPQALSVSNLRYLEAFGAVGLSQGGRLVQFTNTNPPGESGYAAHKRDNSARYIVLDDGRRSMYPRSIRYLTAGTEPGYTIRGGDSIAELTGNLRYSRGSGGRGDETWRLMPSGKAGFSSTNPRPGPPEVAGSFRIASLNVLNFFSSIDNGDELCGPQGEACRGADSIEERRRQLAKLATTILWLDADVVGLIELENNASESLSMIVDAVNTRLSETTYAYVDTGRIHSDVIKTGFIYRLSEVRPVGDHALLDSSVDDRFNDRRNRPALAQTFARTGSDATLTVAVNHFKSKGSDCLAENDPNTNDGQGNCNRTRASAAAALADWLKSDPTQSGDADFLIIGDLNAYTREDPLAAFASAGLTRLPTADSNPYSFLFDAQVGALDHAVVSPSMLPQVAETLEWHINADEPPLYDYNLENGRDPGLFDPDSPYRSSDHDPIVIGLELVP